MAQVIYAKWTKCFEARTIPWQRTPFPGEKDFLLTLKPGILSTLGYTNLCKKYTTGSLPKQARFPD
jgi:hypothetical protein